MAWPNNQTAPAHGFKDLSEYMTYPSRMTESCVGKWLGKDINELNLRHAW